MTLEQSQLLGAFLLGMIFGGVFWFCVNRVLAWMARDA
jgi:hypothetical protein